MKSSIIKYLASGAMAVGLAANVQAAQITGSLHMTGVAHLDNADLGAATQVTLFAAVVTQPLTATGSYFGTGLDLVTFLPFSWNPSSAPVATLWSFLDAGTGWTYTFDLGTITGVSQSSSFLNITGEGTLRITGPGSPWTPTAGAWSFTIDNPGGVSNPTFNFGFASSNVALPDGGTTAILLGGALSVVGLLRRKLTKLS